VSRLRLSARVNTMGDEMSEPNRPKFERTPEQKAEERRIREMHRQNPVREMSADTIRGEDAAQVLRFVASIRREREERGLSVEQLAEHAGLDAMVLTRLEAGQAFNPTVSTLFRIAEALDKNLLLAFDGPRLTD
jgi:ribosome-binding protein aMBF1 (putative translation factor)